MTDSKDFNEPKIAINRVYTRTGDKGATRLVGGQSVSKTTLRIETYGTVDELNSFVGKARNTIELSHSDVLSTLGMTLLRIQHELFNLGSILATLTEDQVPQMPRVRQKEIDALEASIDLCNEELPPLRSFVLPGATAIDAELHMCRTICRRAERLCVALAEVEEIDAFCLAYLNRLSDAFFVWSRFACVKTGSDETLWEPNQG